MDTFTENNSDYNQDDMPFYFPDLTTDVGNKTDIPLGSGTITSILGKGGMANVYEIWNSDLEVYRAVKLIHPTCTDTEKERFDTEIKITAKLHHPYIVEIHGVGKWNGLSYLEMEKIEGVTLKEIIRDRGALPVAVCTAIGIMICEALQYAHSQEYIIYGNKYQGIIHRDLKPSNIMLCKDGIVKLMDFGIARPTDASFHTMDGTVVGTIHYLPPEQLKGEDLDVRTDIYALTATFYEIMTGFRAFPENNLSKLMAEKSKNYYKPLTEFDIKIPGEFKHIIHKCMHHNPEKRLPTVEALLKKLEKIHHSMTKESPRQVIKNLVNSRSYEKIVITPRSHIFRNSAIAACIILGISISIPIIGRVVKFVQIRISTQSASSDKNKESLDKDALAEYRNQIDEANKVEIGEKKIEIAFKTVTRPTSQIDDKIEKTDKNAEEIVEKTFIDSLLETYGTNDLLEVMAKANRLKNFSDILRIYTELLPDNAKTIKNTLLYRLHALVGLKKQNELKTFLSTHPIEDGEYFLEKAKSAFEIKNLNETEEYLTLSLRTPSEYLDRNTLKQEVCYYRALCSTERFDADPSEGNYKNTLGTWHQLKAEMKNDQQHFYYKKAISEMQRIGTKYRESKG